MMKILDARDGLIKFKADSSICLSSFVKVLGQEKQYIAQVMQLRNVAQCSIAYAKLLFLHNGTLQQYDHTLPLRDSEIEDVTDDILTNSLIAESPIILGEFPNSKTPITVNSRIFNKKFLASVDDKSANQIIVQNLTKQFNNLNKKVVIIDMPGILDAKKITAGVDFKIPLDTYSLAFLYKECLSDATPESKSLIIEIFADLAEYSKTVPFVPFDVLKTIIDDMVEKSHVFKLLVLKNKLSKYDRLGYFAKTKKEVDVLDKILQKKCSVIDVSKLDPIFQNHYLSFIYRQLEKQQDSQIILETSNVITKKCLKNIFDCDNAPTMFITHSHFKFLNDIKNLFDNFLITPSLANNQAFKIYNNYLSQLQKNFYLLAGEAFNYIPIVSSLKNIDTLIPQQEKISDDNNSSPQDSDVNDSEIKDSNTENDDVTEENNVECVTEVNLAEESLSVSEEEKPTESTLSHEDLLSSIEEKSEAIIEEMSKDITPPDNMFSSADDSDENELELNSDEEDDNDNDSIFDEISKEPESQVSDVAEDVELEAITDDDNMGENIIESDDLSMTDISQEELFSTLNTEETIENYSSEELSEHDENDNISLDLNESNDIKD